MPQEKTNYSKTVLLPKTNFYMRAGLVKKEPEILKFWKKMNLYKTILDTKKDKKNYVLHDGPPYANGHLHMGHALNKILKDVVVKSRSMMGYKTPYIPGWDCHGLPIEYALLKELKQEKKHITDIAAFRKKARNFARKFIDIQKEEFKRFGVTGDWENNYETMSVNYEKTVIEIFLEFLKKGYVYKGKKTVYWCASCETALADAESEYKNKISPSIYVKFKVENPPQNIFPSGNLFLAVWTTTPWTIPANRAAAVSDTENYAILKDITTKEHYIIAEKLADTFTSECKLTVEKVSTISGEKLIGLKYRHPLSDMLCPVVYADFVTMDSGTGIVHIAPGHGEDDFKLGLKLGLENFCPVDEQGKFTNEAPDFEGIKVYKANDKIIEKLSENGLFIAKNEISHSYPHCWRCKNPIIFRSTEQWFLSLDKDELRKKLLNETKKVNWVPKKGFERMFSMLENRPDWCLSRQRFWGTPITVIYCQKCREVQIDETLFSRIIKQAEKNGSDFWFEKDVKEILPENYKCKCGSTDFRKETDILDVWLDSGVSWAVVLDKRSNPQNPSFPADLYLEGSDQHRGWFQTSLIPSTALKGQAPYKTIFTHGFVLDDKGKAMHKSLGNVVSPQKIIDKYGADILRLWVCLSDYFEDVRISDELLSGPVDTYRKIRNTLRYMLGNLWDYDPQKHKIEDKDLLEIDLYIKNSLNATLSQTVKHYEQFQFRKAIRQLADFCILDMSAFYFDSLKDRLYTLGTNSIERRSAQTVMFEITKNLIKLLAPVLSFTAEEAWQSLKETPSGKNLPESVFLDEFKQSAENEPINELDEKWRRIRKIREEVLKSLEESRQKGIIGSSLEAKIIFETSDTETISFLKETLHLWPSIAIVSQAEIKETNEKELSVKAIVADGQKCPRCWQWKTDIGAEPKYPEICLRCASVLEKETQNA